MRCRSNAGVTLIEVLIAVSLLSLLSVGILMAMRVGLNALGKANTKLLDNRRVAGTQRIIQQQIEGFMPIVGLYLPAPGTPPMKIPFFQGEPLSMRFVSSYSLQEASRGLPQILEFQVIPGAESGGVRLVVNEYVYTGPLSAGFFSLGRVRDPILGVDIPRFRPIETGPRSFVLADRLAFCRFYYEEILPPPALDRWVQRWILPQWPAAVRIEMAAIEEDLSRLRPVTVTAPIHVNRYPIFEYGDY